MKVLPASTIRSRPFSAGLAAAICLLFGVIIAGLSTGSAAADVGPAADIRSVLRIEAEDFDRGAAGEAYHDTDPGFGNIHPHEAVDVWLIHNVGASGAVVGRTRAGEFTRYSFDLVEGGRFAVRLAVASGHAASGSIDVDVDGTFIGSVEAADNGQWFGWTTQRAGEADLRPGHHTITTTWRDGANINFDWLDIVAVESLAPICSVGRTEAELGRVSGRFQTVNDANASGGAYVEVPHGAGGAWNGHSDSWVELCIGVEQAATYRLDARLRTPSAVDNSFYVSVDGGALVEFVAPVTGDAFATARVNETGALDPLRGPSPIGRSDLEPSDGPEVAPLTWDLNRGDHHVRFYLRRDGAQLDEVSLTAEDESPVPKGCVVAGVSVATRIGAIECQALMALYVSTNGPSWTTNTGWGTPTDPCGWYRVECSDTSVTGLYLFDTGLSGPIPPELFELRALRVLDLGSNNLTGSIPAGLANLQGLDGLFLDENDLTGSIPADLGRLGNVRNLYLSHNRFDGSLPAELGGMLGLQFFYATGNQLSGPIPGELGNLYQLQILGLRDNRLSGNLPPELGQLHSLQTLDLYRNRLTGPLPATFADLRSLTYISVVENQLSGDITVPMAALFSQLLDAELADGAGGNNCLTVDESFIEVRDWLDRVDPEWDRCDVSASGGKLD